ncbi:MAG TPA: hypothetical protein DD413_07640, partial [Ruminococcus sp.]|nr:hypothetical protein [Ruminococcus sp.]
LYNHQAFIRYEIFENIADYLKINAPFKHNTTTSKKIHIKQMKQLRQTENDLTQLFLNLGSILNVGVNTKL